MFARLQGTTFTNSSHSNSSFTSSRRFVLAIATLLVLQGSATYGQSAYFSFEGDIPAVGDQHDFLFDLTRSVGSGEDLRFVTYTNQGGTNAAGDTITQTLFDGDLRLWDSLNVLHGQSDQQGGVNYDALISWPGIQTVDTPLNPDPLVADSYRLNHQEYSNNSTGAWAVDLIGPADAMVYTGTTITGTGTTDSLKFGTTGAGANVATYNHSSGTLTLLDQLVLAPSGNAALNLSGGTITAGGLTTINSGGTFTQSAGTFNSNGGTLVDGGTYQRTAGTFNIAAGTTLTVQNGGLYEWGGTSSNLQLNDVGSSILVTGASSTFRQTDSAPNDSSVFITNGFTMDANLGGTIEAEYLLVDDGTMTIDGSGSTLDVTAGNTGGFIHRIGAGLGSMGALTLSNSATGSFESTTATLLRVGANSSTGTIDVLSNADLTLQSLDLNESGASTVTVDGSGSTITQVGASTLNVGSTSGSTGTIDVQNSGVFTTGTGAINVNATGTLNAGVTGVGTFNANGDVNVDGGTINRGNASNRFNLATGKTLTATNDAQINFTGAYNIDLGTTFNILSGADFSTTLFIDIGHAGGDGTLLVDGSGSSVVTAANYAWWGSFGNTANVTFSNSATGDIGEIQLARTSTAGTTGNFSVLSDADVNVDALQIANFGGATTSGAVLVDGAGSTLTQDGASTLIVGHSTDGTATIDVQNNGVFNTGTGVATVNATGTINAGVVGFATFNANGDVNVDGGTINSGGNGRFNLATGKTLTATNDAQINFTGSYNVNAGTTFNILSGADFSTTSYLDIGENGDGTLLVDGSGSSVVTSAAFSYWGFGGDTANITFSNSATGDIGDIGLATSSIAGTTGNFDVLSNADVNIDYLDIAINGGGTTSGVVSVIDAGSTITQGAGENLNIGSAADSFAALNAAFGGVFNASNTGTINVNATGNLNADSGTFNAIGAVSEAGGTLGTSGSINATGSGIINLDGGSPDLNVFLPAGIGGTINMTSGSFALSGTSQTLARGGRGGRGEPGGVGGNLNISGGAATAVDSSMIILRGGRGGDSDLNKGETGGAGGIVTVSTGSLDLYDNSLLLMDGGRGGNMYGGDELGSDGGMGGIINASGGSVTVNDNATVSLGGGNGYALNAFTHTNGDGGDGGQLNVSAGSFTVNGGLVTLEGGNPGTRPFAAPGSPGANGLVDVTGGTFEMNGGEVYTGTFQRSGGGVFNFNDGKLTVAGGTFDPGAVAYTINGPSAVELPTLVLADGATAPGVTGGMVVGNSNRGRLEILNGSTLTSTAADLGLTPTGYGEALVDGAGSIWTITLFSDIAIGESGTGDLTVSNSGAVNSSDDFIIGRNSAGDGTLLVSSGSSVSAGNRIVIGESGTGLATVDSGGIMTSNSYLNIGWIGGSNGTLAATGAGSLIDANSSLNVGGTHSSAGGTGELNIASDATVDVATNLRVWSGGTVNFSGGTVIASTINDTSGGAFNFTGGDLHVGTYAGNLTNQGGTLAPGLSPGITDVTGTYDQQSGALEIEILSGGLSPVAGVDFDRLTADAVLLAGDLDIVPDAGYVPTLGDSFEIINANASVSGTFANVNDLNPTFGFTYDVIYNATDVLLEVIPSLYGDLNLDGLVDALDFGTLAANFGVNGLGYYDGNINGDLYVDAADIGVMFANWTGDAGPVGATVPEPSSLLLVGLAGVLFCSRRRPV